MTGGETQRSTDVLAQDPEMEDEGEAFEMDTYGEEEEPESPTLDKSTAALLKVATMRRSTIPSQTEGLTGKDPDRWVLSDIYRQRLQEIQVNISIITFASGLKVVDKHVFFMRIVAKITVKSSI